MFLCLCGYLALVLPSNRNQTSHSPVLWLSLETSASKTYFIIVRNQHTAPNSSKTNFSSTRPIQMAQQNQVHVDCHKPIQMGQRGQYFMTRRYPCVEISLELKKMTLQNPPFMKSLPLCFNTEKSGVDGGLWWCLYSLG